MVLKLLKDRKISLDQKVAFKTPKMRIPYGVNVYSTNDGKPPKYTLDMSFSNMENDIKIKEFYNAIQQLDENFEQKVKMQDLVY